MEYIAAAALACFVVWQLVLLRRRAQQIRLYTRTAGFTFIGGALPRSFPLGKTSVRGATIRNAVAGDKDNAELVFFDCTIGPGKRRVVPTAVAVRGPNKGFGPEEIEALLSSIQLLAM